MPRLFGLPPGVDFAEALVLGLRIRMADASPEAMARVELYVNTRRMQRRVQKLFAETGPCLLPRIRLVSEILPDSAAGQDGGQLVRRLELAQLVRQLIHAQPDLAPESSAFDLADGLLALIEEMQGEGVAAEVFDRLDVTDQSGHWDRALRFLRLIAPYVDSAADDPEAVRRRHIEALAQKWSDEPPRHPIIVAGSTGSRGATQLFMRAVAGLPQGAVVLPGFDFDQPHTIWSQMRDALVYEEHPQYRFAQLLHRLDSDCTSVLPWVDTPPPSPARNRLLSLALRPAPVTDQWMAEGPRLTDLDRATAQVTLVEAPTGREEAGAIALRLRKAAEDGIRAALISPDRQLTRQVTAALDRWGIEPDDSAGRPLSLSAPGRLLRHTAALFGQRLSAEALLTLLKHPLTNTGAGMRGNHLLWTRELELSLRKNGPAFPTGADLLAWAAEDAGRIAWASWLSGVFAGLDTISALPLSDLVSRHKNITERLSAGPEGATTGELWNQAAGREAGAAMQELHDAAPAGGIVSIADYGALLHSVLQGREVRNPDKPHPNIAIWGTLEARVQGADLVILGGLNEGVWPQQPAPDPWLNRQMRKQAGLLLPERRIGLSAHDFQQAAGATEIWLTRSIRDAEAETVPSRWINRLTNLLSGLPDQGGDVALKNMCARGQGWLYLLRVFETPNQAEIESNPAQKRPSPRPVPAQRPRQLSVTQIKTLIRDPYAIYARHVLGFRALDPIRPTPDAPMRGTILHKVLERFLREGCSDRDDLLRIAQEEFVRQAPWPAARQIWMAKFEKVADWFLETEAARRALGTPEVPEQLGRIVLDMVDFTLTAKADRFDRCPDGSVLIYDYKTGAPPKAKEQAHFDKQLLLEALMVERGGFEGIGVAPVAGASFIGLGSKPEESAAPLDDPGLDQVWAEFQRLIAAYFDHNQGYLSRRAVARQRFEGEFDHLARYGEWDDSDDPVAEDMP